MKALLIATMMVLMANDQPGFAGASLWPPLPSGFVSGRAAGEEDVAKGSAVFVAKVGNIVVGKPIPVQIPQYAYLKDSSGKKVPVVVIQAEEANGTKLFGLLDATGKAHVATGPEVELLGHAPPK